MKKLVGLATFTALTLMAGTANAVSTTINYIDLDPGTDLQTCINQGEAALAASGLSLLSRTNSAAWAESHQADALFMVYCITERQIAVISASAEQDHRSGDMGAYVDQIIGNFYNPPAAGRK